MVYLPRFQMALPCEFFTVEAVYTWATVTVAAGGESTCQHLRCGNVHSDVSPVDQVGKAERARAQ